MQPIVEFKVRNQIISRSDSFQVVAKSRNYLYARFDFLTDDWKGKTKTAIFKTDGQNYGVALTHSNPMYNAELDAYLVPFEFLENKGVGEVTVFGGDLITVNCAYVNISASGYTDDVKEYVEPTPSLYEQWISEMRNETKGIVDRMDALEKRVKELSSIRITTKDGGIIIEMEDK